jgi:hypothetical protein
MKTTPLLRQCSLIFSMFMALALCACEPSAQTQSNKESKAMDSQNTKSVTMSVALFGYQDRTIFDVYLNGVDIGVSAGQPFSGNAGVMTGVKVMLGPQVVTWRDGETGKTTKASNQPVFTDPGRDYSYVGVHIYPDNTVELVPAKFWPDKTEKGLEINRQWELKHGK